MKAPQSNASQVTTNNSNARVCFNCRETGHYIANCPYAKNKPVASAFSNSVDVVRLVVFTFEFLHQLFIFLLLFFFELIFRDRNLVLFTDRRFISNVHHVEAFGPTRCAKRCVDTNSTRWNLKALFAKLQNINQACQCCRLKPTGEQRQATRRAGR